MKDQDMLELIHQAQASPHGIEIETNNTDAFKGLFYATRKKHQIKGIKLQTSPTPNHLWIVNAPGSDA